MIDYEVLLHKYITHVFEFEDRTFTSNEDFADSMALFSKEEKDKLQIIADAIKEAAGEL